MNNLERAKEFYKNEIKKDKYSDYNLIIEKLRSDFGLKYDDIINISHSYKSRKYPINKLIKLDFPVPINNGQRFEYIKYVFNNGKELLEYIDKPNSIENDHIVEITAK